MSYKGQGTDHADLIAKLKQHGIIQREDVATAMLKVDRGDFAPTNPYMDRPQRIGFGTTISAPSMQLSLHILHCKYSNLNGINSPNKCACFETLMQ